MLTVLIVDVVTAVDVAVVSVDGEAVETGVVVCVVTLDTYSDVGGVVVVTVLCCCTTGPTEIDDKVCDPHCQPINWTFN